LQPEGLAEIAAQTTKNSLRRNRGIGVQ